jgi:hypothetical protein
MVEVVDVERRRQSRNGDVVRLDCAMETGAGARLDAMVPIDVAVGIDQVVPLMPDRCRTQDAQEGERDHRSEGVSAHHDLIETAIGSPSEKGDTARLAGG